MGAGSRRQTDGTTAPATAHSTVRMRSSGNVRKEPTSRRRTSADTPTTAREELSGFVRFMVYDRLAATFTGVLGIGGVVAVRTSITDFLRGHPEFIPPVLFVVVAAVELLVWRRIRRGKPFRDRALGILLLVTTSVTATAVAVSISTAALHPGWCPGWLCPPPPLPTAVGSHDDNLELRFSAIDAPGFYLPDGVSTPPDQLPTFDQATTVAAGPLTGGQASMSLLLHVRNLSQARVDLSVDGVQLQVEDSRPLDSQVVALVPSEAHSFAINPVDLTYSGEQPGARLAAQFGSNPAADSISLIPGESDEFTLHLHSTVTGDLRFRVVVLYHIITGSHDEAAEASVTLDPAFRATFADRGHWQAVELSNGGLTAVAGDG